MRLIKPNFEIWDQEDGLEGVYKQIERAGRVCYASDPIEGKAKDFVDRMIKNGHTAMLEHGTIYLAIPMTTYAPEAVNTYSNNPYSMVNECNEFVFTDKYGDKVCAWCVTTNLRVLVENDCMEDLEFLCKPTRYHEKRVTVHFTTNIGVSREFNRHRVDSIAEQSTRYCNYGKDKFDGVGINLPTWVESEMQKLNQITDDILPTFEQLKQEYFSVSDQGLTKDDWGDIEWWLWSNLVAEESYLKLIEKGRKPQEARVVLPLDTNTELIHTAFIPDWNHFFDLRARGTTGAPHPDAKILAEPLLEVLKERNLIV